MRPVSIVRSSVKTTAGRKYLPRMLCQNDCFGACSGLRSVEVCIVLLILQFLLPSQVTSSARSSGCIPLLLNLERQVQHCQDHVDGFNADEWDNDAAEAIDRQIPE